MHTQQTWPVDQKNPFEEVDVKLDLETLSNKVLKNKKKIVFDLRMKGWTFEEIGKKLHITKSRASQIFRQDIRYIQKAIIEFKPVKFRSKTPSHVVEYLKAVKLVCLERKKLKEEESRILNVLLKEKRKKRAEEKRLKKEQHDSLLRFKKEQAEILLKKEKEAKLKKWLEEEKTIEEIKKLQKAERARDRINEERKKRFASVFKNLQRLADAE